MRKILSLSFILFLSTFANAQNYKVEKSEIFQPQTKKILLLKDSAKPENKVIFFKTPLNVNTDGTPTSYNPTDPLGESIAVNTVCNAIAVYKNSDVPKKNLCLYKITKAEAISVFIKWRDGGYLSDPAGYRISWKSVLASVESNGKTIPCIFKSGEYKGYFGSMTNLQNNLPLSEQGECQAKNQLDALKIPALVLAGGNNPMKTFGAKVGDLVVAYNPDTNKIAFAVIGDTGPPANLGEGSVALNMVLLNRTDAPKTRKDTYDYGVENALIAIIPASKSYRIKTPYTAENITERIKKWQQDAGFVTPDKFIQMLKNFQTQL